MANLNPNDFTHELDRKALNALIQIPGFTPLLKGFMKIYNERVFKILNMSSKIKLSPDQLPQLYGLLPPVCEKLGIEEPELYLELNRSVNAYTSGDTTKFITLTSGLVETCTEEEISTVIAHECGHILCRHTLYHTMGQMLLNGAAAALGLGRLFTTALETGFAYWMRCSEFSADRAAIVYNESAEPLVDIMVRFAGADKSLDEQINRELFMAQAEEYKQYVDDSTWNKILEFLILRGQDHPLTTVRAYEACKWVETNQYQLIVNAMNGITPEPFVNPMGSSMEYGNPMGGQSIDPSLQTMSGMGNASTGHAVNFCPKCGTSVNAEWAFCKMCGQPLKGQQG